MFFHSRISSAQVTPVECEAPWLGSVVYPAYCRVKVRKIRYASRQLTQRYAAYQSGTISFAEFNVAVQSWINYVRYGDTWGLRKHVLKPFKRPVAKNVSAATRHSQ